MVQITERAEGKGPRTLSQSERVKNYAFLFFRWPGLTYGAKAFALPLKNQQFSILPESYNRKKITQDQGGGGH
jgi:hypothetical protein